jgi:TonB family protein
MAWKTLIITLWKRIEIIVNKVPFAFFCIFSISLHSALFFALSSLQPKSLSPPQNIFQVEMVPWRPQQTKETAVNAIETYNTRSQRNANSAIKKGSNGNEGNGFGVSYQPSAAETRAPGGSRGEATIYLHDADTKYSSYLAHVKYKIESSWTYPSRAAEEGLGGKLMLRFSIGGNGDLLDVTLLKSSGYLVLDREALSAIQKAAPFKPLPSSFGLSRLNILSSFVYQLLS